MKIYTMTTIIFMALSIISGCASASKTISPESLMAEKRAAHALPITVPEPFHFNIQDPKTREYFQSMRNDSFTNAERLEYLMLRSLAVAETREQLVIGFDRMWEQHAEIRNLVERPSLENGWQCPLAVIYYLLSVSPDNQWQRKMAERLYLDALRDCPPENLSGYALHFYIQGLLNNGRVETALPFLLLLEQFTTPQIYLEDLTIAMEKAAANKDSAIAGQLLFNVCQAGLTNNLILPEEAITSSIGQFRNPGDLASFQKILYPLEKRYPDFGNYSFVQQLDFAESLQNISFNEKPARIPLPSAKTDHVQVDIQVIEADLQGKYIDPELKGIGAEIFKSFKFKSIILRGHQTFSLCSGESGELTLPDAQILRIILQSQTANHARIEVAVLDGQKQVFQTYIESRMGGVTIFGGPSIDEKSLLIRVTTYLHTEKANG